VTEPSHTSSRVLGRTVRALAGATLALGLLTACGGDDGSDAAATTTTVRTSESTGAGTPSSASATGSAEAETITATETEFQISLDQDSFPAGSYRIEVRNDGTMTHNLDVERDGDEVAGTDGIDPGRSATLDVTLEPGTYVFYCDVGNHRAMGMEVTVEVTS
jgi:uncharacterized cupredoxin-like copper-binding protein